MDDAVTAVRSRHHTLALLPLDPGERSRVQDIPMSYIVLLHASAYEPEKLWYLLQQTVLDILVESQTVPHAMTTDDIDVAVARFKVLTGKVGWEALVLMAMRRKIPQDIWQNMRLLETRYTRFVSETAEQHIWSNLGDCISLLLTGIYLIVGYQYLDETYHVEMAESGLLDTLDALIRFTALVLYETVL